MKDEERELVLVEAKKHEREMEQQAELIPLEELTEDWWRAAELPRRWKNY